MAMSGELMSQRESSRHRGGVRGQLQHRRLMLLVILCLLSSAVLIAAPMLPRTYRLSGSMTITGINADASVGQALDDEVRQVLDRAGNASMAVRPDGSREISLTGAGPSRDQVFVQLHEQAEQIKFAIEDKVAAAVAKARRDLEKDAQKANDHEEELSRQADEFRLSHRGALPDDPSSVTGQFETLKTRLDEKQQRLRLVTEQIGRLEEYQKNKKAGIEQPLPQPLPTVEEAAPVPTGVAKPENDPEVLALTAQLQLINDQLDEQTNTMHRTEQHPYVIDLRSKQADLQKKLDAAKARAEAGKPAPPTVRVAVKPTGADPTLVAAQEVDLQLENLRAERDALDAELKQLAAQRDAMQKEVDAVLPVRQQYEKLTQQLAEARRQKETLATARDDFQKRFGDDGKGLTVGGLVIHANSRLPDFPRLPLVYAASVLLGLSAALCVAWLIARLDKALHTPAAVAEAAGIPVLGAVPELRSALQRRKLKAWHTMRPVIAMIFVILLGVSAWICYLHLSDPAYADEVKNRGALTMFSMAGGSK